ncbi:hypothetical protein [Chryseobacterium nepalense]|uniref:hypothetical protein n=1 Tax=Chryseobacterium nepalense TaxID=1854498 RepID=UPI002E063E15|nr:hypothetical protein [Chryseobacterium nepalense]
MNTIQFPSLLRFCARTLWVLVFFSGIPQCLQASSPSDSVIFISEGAFLHGDSAVYVVKAERSSISIRKKSKMGESSLQDVSASRPSPQKKYVNNHVAAMYRYSPEGRLFFGNADSSSSIAVPADPPSFRKHHKTAASLVGNFLLPLCVKNKLILLAIYPFRVSKTIACHLSRPPPLGLFL